MKFIDSFLSEFLHFISTDFALTHITKTELF